MCVCVCVRACVRVCICACPCVRVCVCLLKKMIKLPHLKYIFVRLNSLHGSLQIRVNV